MTIKKMIRMPKIKNLHWVALTATLLFLFGSIAIAQELENEFTDEFMVEGCTFKDKGNNPYFPLQPGYHLALESDDERVEITVTQQKERIFLDGQGKASIKARVVEERHFAADELVEVSRNFFAICKETGDVFYFGEEVDDYENGEIVGHGGAWKAGINGAQPGIIMPGRFLLGSRYFQEVAPGIAMDRAENAEMNLHIQTGVGTFDNCVMVVETTPLHPDEQSEKTYCRGIGLVMDDEASLEEFGFG